MINCISCGKKPSEISEYISAAKSENTSPEKYVLENEGTFNRRTGKFYCTSCYIKAGMPLGVAEGNTDNTFKIEDKLSKIFDEFVEMFIPEHLQGYFIQNAFIAGGCIYSLANNKEPKDYDFFVTDKTLAHNLINYFKSHEDNIPITKYAITLGNGKYQIVIKYIGFPKDVVAEFDFKHNMFYFYQGKLEGLVEHEYLESNKLSFNDDRARDICGVLLRIPKFIARGMTISKREVASILLKLHDNFDENEVQILNDTSHY